MVGQFGKAREARSLRGGLGGLAALVGTIRDDSPHWFGQFGKLAVLVGEAVGTRSLSGGRRTTRRTAWRRRSNLRSALVQCRSIGEAGEARRIAWRSGDDSPHWLDSSGKPEKLAALFGEAGELAALVGEAVGTRSLSGGRRTTRRTAWRRRSNLRSALVQCLSIGEAGEARSLRGGLGGLAALDVAIRWITRRTVRGSRGTRRIGWGSCGNSFPERR